MGDQSQDPDAFFKDKKTITISEVATMLEIHTENRKRADPDYQPNLLVGKTLEYTNLFAGSKNTESMMKIRACVCHRCADGCARLALFPPPPGGALTPPLLRPLACRTLAEAGLTHQEMASVANLQVQTADEAKKLVPTLEVGLGICRCRRRCRCGGRARAGNASAVLRPASGQNDSKHHAQGPGLRAFYAFLAL